MMRLTIAGRVQGVGYRAAFAERARALGLAGWVRNRRDGAVEAEVAGEALALDAIVAWAKRGPPAAEVASVAVEQVAAQAAPVGDFKILPTL